MNLTSLLQKFALREMDATRDRYLSEDPALAMFEECRLAPVRWARSAPMLDRAMRTSENATQANLGEHPY
jgi:hypothetical protein